MEVKSLLPREIFVQASLLRAVADIVAEFLVVEGEPVGDKEQFE